MKILDFHLRAGMSKAVSGLTKFSIVLNERGPAPTPPYNRKSTKLSRLTTDHCASGYALVHAFGGFAFFEDEYFISYP